MERYNARPQPKVVEARLGVKEYWYDTFYRVLVVPLGGDCYLLSIDTYSKETPRGKPVDVLAAEEAPVALEYYEYSVEGLPVRGEADKIELVVLRYNGRRELVNTRLKLCGLKEPPGYDDVEKLYRWLLELLRTRTKTL